MKEDHSLRDPHPNPPRVPDGVLAGAHQVNNSGEGTEHAVSLPDEREETDHTISPLKVGKGENFREWKTSPDLWERLKPLVQKMRQNPTDAEDILWQCLRNKQLGVKFRRQHSIEGYVLDFYASSLKLAIGLDGSHHAETEQAAQDAHRDAFMLSRGIRTIRFWNQEVFNNLNEVLETIWQAIHENQPSTMLKQPNS